MTDALPYATCLGCAIETWCTYHDGHNWYCCMRCHDVRPLCECQAAEYVAGARAVAREAGLGVKFAKEYGKRRRGEVRNRYAAISAAYGAIIAIGGTWE